jgi:hypothetical protein
MMKSSSVDKKYNQSRNHQIENNECRQIVNEEIAEPPSTAGVTLWFVT